ncbi:MAG: response regulator [bacterium]|nr:response regulator [bacterium]
MKPRRLLLVEDDEFLARLLKEKLEQERYQVTLAVDGQQALDALRQPPLPEVVILDLILPVVDGFEVLQNIRTNDDAAIKSLPVIVLSNLGSAPDIQRVRDLGANEYLVKAQMTPREIVEHVVRFTK